MDTNAIEKVWLELNPNATADELAHAINLIDALRDRAKELQQIMEDRMVEIIQERGEIVIGPVRYYVGEAKTTKCTDQPAALEAALDAAGGDFETLCRDYLSSNALKYGSFKKEMPEVFERCFTVETKPELKEGKPSKRLQKVDTRYLR